jgi:hypothetical protein
LLIILIVLSVLVIAAVGVLALMKGRSDSPGNDSNVAGPAANGTAPADESFNREAVLQGDEEFANLRSGPASDAPIIARIGAGEPFNTYEQDGIWWRVQVRGGLTGYLERAHIRLRDPVAVPPLTPAPGNQAAPAPGNTSTTAPTPTTPQQQTPQQQTPQQQTPQQQRPRPRPEDRQPRRDPRINDANAGVMYDYCKGAGAGTPQCRQLGLSNRRRRR